MQYNFNGKQLNIPDDELDKLVDTLGISLYEAIDIWLTDNDYKVNEQVEELEKKAKENHITATIHQAKSTEKKERKKVERKPDEIKDGLIEELALFLNGYATNIKITKIGKLVEFDINDDHYKLDLIRQRKPKGEA